MALMRAEERVGQRRGARRRAPDPEFGSATLRIPRRTHGVCDWVHPVPLFSSVSGVKAEGTA
jgi:hypothetical protein